MSGTLLDALDWKDLTYQQVLARLIRKVDALEEKWSPEAYLELRNKLHAIEVRIKAIDEAVAEFAIPRPTHAAVDLIELERLRRIEKAAREFVAWLPSDGLTVSVYRGSSIVWAISKALNS